jgi:hypothetical protein
MEGVDDLDVLDVRGGIPGLQKRLIKSQILPSCFCLMVLRVSAVDGHSYVPYKFLMNMAHSWSQK